MGEPDFWTPLSVQNIHSSHLTTAPPWKLPNIVGAMWWGIQNGWTQLHKLLPRHEWTMKCFHWIVQGRGHFRTEKDYILNSSGDSRLYLCITTTVLFYPIWILAPSWRSFTSHIKITWGAFSKILMPRAALGDSDLTGWGWDLGMDNFYKPPRGVLLMCSQGWEAIF